MKLFTRLIVWFLAAFLASFFITLFVTLPAHNALVPRYNAMQDAESALAIYQAGDKPALRAWLRGRREQGLSRGMLFNAEGRPVLNHRRSMSRAWMQHLPTLLNGQDAIELPDKRRLIAASAVDNGGQQWRWVAMLPPPRKPPWALLLTRLTLGAMLLIVAAWFVARRLVLPIGQLQKTSRELAAGKLDSRVPESSVVGNDEIANLGRDFNRMADRLQQLMENQQQLLRDVSHELRSPLGRLQLAVELARQPKNSAMPSSNERADDELLDRISREGDRLEAMIADVLALARADVAADVQLPINLAASLQQVVDDAQFEGAQRSLTITYSTNVSPAMVYLGNGALLSSGIENVLRNAIKWSPNGGSIEVSMIVQGQNQAAGGSYVISVRDYGPGVPATELERLFDPFYRVSGARERQANEAGGHGLGLAIAARAFRSHGGDIKAELPEGGGLRVLMVLP